MLGANAQLASDRVQRLPGHQQPQAALHVVCPQPAPCSAAAVVLWRDSPSNPELSYLVPTGLVLSWLLYKATKWSLRTFLGPQRSTVLLHLPVMYSPVVQNCNPTEIPKCAFCLTELFPLVCSKET